MKKTTAKVAGVLVILLLVGLAGVFWFYTSYLVVDGQVYERDAAELDLSGKQVPDLEKLAELTELKQLDLRGTGLTTEEYEEIRRLLPECTVLWSVPFQSAYLEEDTAEVKVTTLTEADVEQMKYLPNLTSVDATGCKDYDAIMQLKEARPEVDVRYRVSVNGREYEGNTTELVLENADIQELEQAIAYLPLLTRVTFTGAIADSEQIAALKEAYPGITFVWDFEVLGIAANSLDEELILSGIEMETVEAVENALKYFYNLKRVEMCDCGIPSEEMDALWKRHPETRFVWTVQVGVCKLRTDVTTFMPYKFGYDGYSKLFDKHMAEMKYCVDLICLDMGHMGISDYSFLEYMPNMKYLILAGTKGTDFSALANLKELVFLELFMTKFDQAEVLTGLTKLEDLNIGNAGIDNVEPLKQMTWLKRLWLPATRNVWRVEREALQEALPDTIVNFAGMGSTDEGWRESPNYYAMRDLLGMGYFPGYERGEKSRS